MCLPDMFSCITVSFKVKKKIAFRLVTIIIPVFSALKKHFKKVLVINDKDFEFIAVF